MPSIDNQQSKIKMVALTRRGFDNVTWYSYLKENRRRSELICDGMLKRFKEDRMFAVTRVIQFYERNILIRTVRI